MPKPGRGVVGIVVGRFSALGVVAILLVSCGSAPAYRAEEKVGPRSDVAPPERTWASAPGSAVFESAAPPVHDLLPGALALGASREALPEGIPEALATSCNEQAPQEFLIRGSYVWQPTATPEERSTRRAIHRRAVEYRSRNYGFVEGSGDPKWNALAPGDLTRDGRFFGVPVRMNNRVLTALGCVEKVIAHECASEPYVPRVLDGLRTRNTFHNDEVSNHLYGIAIDIDPDRNSCCGCVPPLSEWPRCKKPVSSPFERSLVPKCWVDRFERFGFYWLGYDQLEDTMHFEFLGDPAKIAKKKPG